MMQLVCANQCRNVAWNILYVWEDSEQKWILNWGGEYLRKLSLRDAVVLEKGGEFPREGTNSCNTSYPQDQALFDWRNTCTGITEKLLLK